jgi:hypothetical protein
LHEEVEEQEFVVDTVTVLVEMIAPSAVEHEEVEVHENVQVWEVFGEPWIALLDKGAKAKLMAIIATIGASTRILRELMENFLEAEVGVALIN